MITVLYVDDEPLNLMLFEVNFRNRYRVITALSGEEGLQKLSEHSDVDVVISDMKMPTMNGVRFIHRIKELYPEIPCIILTGYDLTPEIQEAIADNKVIEYLAKPFDITQIEKSIEKILG